METAGLIDVTQMRHVCNYLLNDSEIDAIVDVKDMELAEIGDMMVDESSKSDEIIEKAKGLFHSGKLAVYWNVDEVKIPLTMRCIVFAWIHFI
jgi:hypothetical protein